jgi:glutamate-1-semialdehyde 2,1-aminomutase
MIRFKKSESHLCLAEKVIPLGSQTFSKSRTQYPVGISPLYAKNATGSLIQDLDGNWYVDLVNSLAAITLGYSNKKVNRAVKKQLTKGVIYSLPGVLEQEVASKIINLVPSAELVRFGKNGTDATSAAVRLARAHTGRELIAVCGYHGWADWYIGSTTRNKGVPASTSALTKTFKYNDLDSLNRIISENPSKIAAVILEPMNSEFPQNNFLEKIREICSENDIILIFDETITGFRLSSGGAQKYFGVTPDISTFGKGIANGFPLSVVAGSKKIMMEMEEIFFSGTFGGELLSLAAAKKVLELHEKKDICKELNSIGSKINNEVNNLINQNRLNSILSLSGHPSWTFLNWSPSDKYSANELKTFFMQEMFSRGVLILNTHNVSTALRKRDIRKIVKAYSQTLSLLSTALTLGDLNQRLKVAPVEPLFKIRN